MSSSKAALIPIMNSQYDRIAAIEEAAGIRLREGDMRPRIDYFHDAVRALTSGESPYAPTGRLSVEHLAWDVAQLRLVPGNPLGRLHKGTEKMAGAELMTQEDAAYRMAGASPRAIRAELAQLYKDYTVLFVALFAEVADINFKCRQEEMDAAVADIAQVQAVIGQLAKGQINSQQGQLLLEQVEQDSLREQAQAAIASSDVRAKANMLLANLKGAEQKLNAQGQAIDKAHLSYVTGQLAIYEESKDIVKRLAAQGMNLAGKFVENAMQQSAGKGRDR